METLKLKLINLCQFTTTVKFDFFPSVYLNNVSFYVFQIF